MTDLLRRMALGYSTGALAALAVLVLAWLLGQAGVGPAQAALGRGEVFLRCAQFGLWGLSLGLFLGQGAGRVLATGTCLGLAPGLWAFLHPGWPRGGSGPLGLLFLLGYCLLWGFLAALMAVSLGEPGRSRR
jgi:hypothetical protein